MISLRCLLCAVLTWFALSTSAPARAGRVAALVPLAFYAAIALLIWQRYRRSRLLTQGLAAFGILITLINGIFQEEALFAPLAQRTRHIFLNCTVPQLAPCASVSSRAFYYAVRQPVNGLSTLPNQSKVLLAEQENLPYSNSVPPLIRWFRRR